MILGIVKGGLYIIGKWDEPLPLERRQWMSVLAGAAAEWCVIVYILLRSFQERWGDVLLQGAGDVLLQRAAPAFLWTAAEVFLWAVTGGCLLLACITDGLICQVYNFTWWIGLAGVLPLLWQRLQRAVSGGEGFGLLYSLLFFCLLQLLFFARTYGRADCYAFCICAGAEAAVGIGLQGFLLHMLLAYFLLFVVQLFRGNVGKGGNLKQSVAFVPYIAAAFWITVSLYTFRVDF